MLGDVKKILLEMREAAGWGKVVTVNKPKIEVDNTKAFLFVNHQAGLTPRTGYNGTSFEKDYNSLSNKETGANMKATPHTFRHSFCCWLCENVRGKYYGYKVYSEHYGA